MILHVVLNKSWKQHPKQQKLSSSSSSCCADSSDLPDPLSPPVSIVHRSHEVFKATSCIRTGLLYIDSSWSFYLCPFLCRGPQKYVTYEFVLISPAVSGMSDSSNLDSFRDGCRWPYSCCFVGCCFFCNCHQAFSAYYILSISLKMTTDNGKRLGVKGVSSWCNGQRDGQRNRSKRVRTPVALLRSLSGKCPWERYEPLYSPSYGLKSTRMALALNNLQRLICH